MVIGNKLRRRAILCQKATNLAQNPTIASAPSVVVVVVNLVRDMLLPSAYFLKAL
jgi:hypothetical protein